MSTYRPIWDSLGVEGAGEGGGVTWRLSTATYVEILCGAPNLSYEYCMCVSYGITVGQVQEDCVVEVRRQVRGCRESGSLVGATLASSSTPRHVFIRS